MLIQNLIHLFLDKRRHAPVKGLGHSASNTGQGIRVAAQRHGVSYGVLIIVGIINALNACGTVP